MATSRANLTRYYLYVILNGLQFTWTTWLAYVLAHGGNPGWAEAAYHLSIWLGEVPTGAVADLWGRKLSMVVGLVLGGVSSLLYFSIHGTLSACLVMALSGLAGTFLSGADTALLYETAEAAGGEELARKAMARASALQLGALSLAPIIGGLLYQWHDWSPAMARVLVTVAVVPVVLSLKDRRSSDAPSARKVSLSAVWRQTWEAARTVRRSRPTLILLSFGWIYATVVSMVSQFGQAYFPYLGLTMTVTGVVFTLGRLLSTGGSSLAERIGADWAGRVLRWAPLGFGFAYLAMGLAGLLPGAGLGIAGTGALVGVAGFLAGDALDGILYPIYQHRLNRAIPSAQRATILSLESAGFSMIMAVSFPAASYLQPVTRIYTVVGLAAAVLGLLWAARRQKSDHRVTNCEATASSEL